MRILVIGYGSIGRRHEEVISSLNYKVDIISSQKIVDRIVYQNLEKINNLNDYDYFIIASSTNQHYEQLKYIESKVSNKIIFCEKPLFETYKYLEIKRNKVYIGYVLRFHPLLKKLKQLLKDDKVISINVNCGQYLPTWRKGRAYQNSYSAKKSEGGGVLLDLSHEVDYIQWLCGTIGDDIKSYQVKISDLEIDSDDLTTFIAKTEDNTIVNMSIDYISKITYRKIIIHTFSYTYSLDFIDNKLSKKDKNGIEELFTYNNLERNSMFKEMHTSILQNNTLACTYDEALEVMKTIRKIKEQNNG